MKLVDFIKNSNPKKTIVYLFVVQLLVFLFVEGYIMVAVGIVFNTIIFLYGLFLIKRQDYISLRFFLCALIIVNVIGLLSNFI